MIEERTTLDEVLLGVEDNSRLEHEKRINNRLQRIEAERIYTEITNLLFSGDLTDDEENKVKALIGDRLDEGVITDQIEEDTNLEYTIFRNTNLSLRLNMQGMSEGGMRIVKLVSSVRNISPSYILAVPVLDNVAKEIGGSIFSGIRNGEFMFVKVPYSLDDVIAEREVQTIDGVSPGKYKDLIHGECRPGTVFNLFQYLHRQDKLSLAFDMIMNGEAHLALNFVRSGFEEVAIQSLERHYGRRLKKPERPNLLGRLKSEGLITRGEFSQGQEIIFAANAAIHSDTINVSKVNALLAVRWLLSYAERTIGHYSIAKGEGSFMQNFSFSHPPEKEDYMAYVALASQIQLHRKKLISRRDNDRIPLLEAIKCVWGELPDYVIGEMNDSDLEFLKHVNFLKKTENIVNGGDMSYPFVENAAIFVYSAFNIFQKRDLSEIEDPNNYMDPNLITIYHRKGLIKGQRDIIDLTNNEETREAMALIEHVAYPILKRVIRNIPQRRYTKDSN